MPSVGLLSDQLDVWERATAAAAIEIHGVAALQSVTEAWRTQRPSYRTVTFEDRSVRSSGRGIYCRKIFIAS